MAQRRRPALARASIAALFVFSVVLTALPPTAGAADDEALFAGFERVWARVDAPVARGDRGFIWGPQPVVPLIVMEPMAGLGLPGDVRPVLYWDKARMEINAPDGDPRDPYYVTNGLLVAEMVTGRVQVGVDPPRYEVRAPAETPFGDLDDPAGPTYRSFGARLGDPPLRAGEPIAQGLDRAGTVAPADAGGVTCRAVVAETQHCVPGPFWDFLNARGAVYDPDSAGVAEGALFDPLFYATGLPITEAYWITARVAGRPARVLVQLFERRVLTYNPANVPGARVEMGNAGLHYYGWRYTAILPDAPPTGLDPAMRRAIGAIAEGGSPFAYLPGAVAGRYQLIFQDLSAEGAYGFASRQYHLLVVDSAFAGNPRGAGIILAHEMQHAHDFNTVGSPRSAAECYAFEARGFLAEAYLWMTWYGPAGKSPAGGRLDREENSILRQIRVDPATFVNSLIRGYTENGQCPAYPSGGTPDRLLTPEGLPEGIAAALPVADVFAALRAALADDGTLAAALAEESPFTITPR